MMNMNVVGSAVALTMALSGPAWAAQAGILGERKALPGAEAGIAQLVTDTNGAARVSLHDATGTARFVRLGSPSSVGQGAAKAPASIAAAGSGSEQERSRAFLARYGSVFGIRDVATELVETRVDTDAMGGKHITFEQRYRGLPVFAGQLKSHFNAAGELTVVNGTFIPGIDLNPTPSLSAQAAAGVALKKVGDDLDRTGLSAIRRDLLVFREGLARGLRGLNRLAWRIEVGNGGDVREFVFIDAHSGKFIEQFTGIHDALNRRAYDGQGSTLSVPPNYPLTPFWVEGQLPFPTLNTEADNMILASGETYNLYFNAFGRDSFDGIGGTMDAIFNRGNACPNASWNGTFISFCPGLTSDDVTAHEWGHAYTQYTHDLIYAWQPGALNESYSDIFGETVDRINNRGGDTPFTARTAGSCSTFTSGAGTDNSVRWLLGEDDTGPLAGALRDMWNPTCYNDPGKVSDTQYTCDPAFTDQGGVHTNSGVPNHAYALLVDGGTYNSQVIDPIGLTKAAHIYFRAQSVYQGPASDFTDHADAIEQSCSDLFAAGTDLPSLTTGLPSGEIVSAADCTEVAQAMLAVQMRTPPSSCAFQPLLAPNPPNRCDVGATQTTALFEDFEVGSVGWTVSSQFPGTGFTPRDWVRGSGLPDGRAGFAFFAVDPAGGTCAPGGDESSVLHLDSPSIVLPLAAAPRATFDHWVGTEATWDGGNLKVSVNGGPFVLIAKAHYTFNPYNLNALQTTAQGNTNPLQGQPAFSGADGGSVSGSWGRSHVNLAPYAAPGDTVQLRFDFGTDGCGGTFGWYVDDVSVHACLIAGPEVAVSGNGVDIVDGDTTPRIADSTNFGIVNIAATTVTRTFTVQNVGTNDLAVSTPTLSGPNAADFSVTLAPVSPVTPLGSTTFQITFDPSASGPRNATVSFVNDDPDENPFDFSITGTGTAGSATCAMTALLNDNAISGNARAPQTRNRFARSVYLIKASELAAAGFVPGTTPTSIGWNYQVGGTAGSAPLIVYMENTPDTTNLKSTTWATAITPMTVVHNATTALPAAAGPFDINMTGGAPFIYTGGGLYIAFDWGQYTGTLGTTTVVYCNSTGLAGGLLGAQSNVAAPTTLAATAFRPETRLNGLPTAQNDAAVTAVISYGQLPFGIVPAQATKAVVTNLGAAVLTNVPVTLNVTGADTFTNTQVIPTLGACGGRATVTFASFTPGAIGSDTVTASVTTDDIPANDSMSKPLNITASSYSYKYPGSTATSGVGFNGGTGAFVGKFTTTAASSLTAVTLEFAATPATTYRVAIYGDSGSGTPSTVPLYLDAADRAVTAVGPVTITLPTPIALGHGTFFAGIQQTNTTNANLSFDAEAPIRSGSFYLATPNPPAAWSDFSPANSFKLNIGVEVTPLPTAAPTVTSPTSTSVTGTTATLGGDVTSDGGSLITERGVVYSQTATNNDPVILGTGVTKVTVSGTTGLFATGVTGLTPLTGHSFKAFATNGVGTSYTSVATFTTTCPVITLGSLPNGNVTVVYTGSATASGGTGPYTYAVTSGTLPGGLSLTASGAGAGDLTGTPTTAGTFTFNITATDTFGAGTCTGTQSYSVLIGPEPGQDFYTVTPCRVLDTRNAVGPLGGPALVALADRTFLIAGACGIPADAKAVSLNLAVTGPTAAGNIRLHPGGTSVPLVSSINFRVGQTRSNNAVVPLSALGELAAYLDQLTGTAHLILDVNGYFK